MSEFSASQKTYMDELFSKLTSTFNEKSAAITNEFKQQIDNLKQEIHTAINSYEDKITKLEDKNNQLENKLVQLQRKIRKNNLLIFGIEKAEPNLWEHIIKIINETLEVEIHTHEINDIYRIGHTDKSMQPVVIEFLSYQKKLLVLKNAKKLKGKSISISQDQCFEDRAKNKILLKHLKEAKSAGIQAYIKRGKLIIGNEVYSVEDLEHSALGKLETQDIRKADSAPQTPNPSTRQKRLLQEFGLDNEDHEKIQQEHKKTKPSEKTQTTRTEKSTISKPIQTRSNSVSSKPK